MRIEKEFEGLLPPLTDEEFRQLEENILEDGIRDPLVVWKTPSGNEVLVDGHNRLKIAQKHNLKYETVYMTFDDFDDVKLWIYRNQKGRREMNPVQHIEVLEELKPALAKEAKRNSLANLKNSESQKSDARGRTDEKIGKMAGVSRDTVRKVEHILDKGSEETKAAARSGQISVNEAYKRTVKENEPPKPDIPTIEEEHAAFVEKKKTAPVVTIDEIEIDKTNQRIIALDTIMAIEKAAEKMENFMLDNKTNSIAKVKERIGALTNEEKHDLLQRMRSIRNFASGIIKLMEGD